VGLADRFQRERPVMQAAPALAERILEALVGAGE
jgi:hypothetical protein